MQQKNHTEHGVNQFSTQNFPGLNFSHTRKFEHSVLRVARLPDQNWSQERLPVLCCLSQPQYFPKRAASPITIGVSMQWQWVTRVQTINPFTYVSIIFVQPNTVQTPLNLKITSPRCMQTSSQFFHRKLQVCSVLAQIDA